MSEDLRKQLLRKRLQEAGLATAPAAPRRAPGELSAAQRRMWFVQTLDPADTTLNICVAYRLTGELDAVRLRAAFTSFVARHDILRTTYSVVDGEPQASVRAEAEYGWQEHDLRELTEAGRDRRLEVLARRDFSRPFDLANDCPLRVTLARTADDEHVVALTIHHIAWDDESWPVLFTELETAYAGGALAPVRAQYAAVPLPGGGDAEFWRNTLTPLPERIDLPAAPATGTPSIAAARSSVSVPSELLTRAAEFGRAQAATPFMVLLAAFEAVVHRYTGAGDFAISVPVVDRTREATDVVGYFGNTVLIRAILDGRNDFAALVEASRDQCTAAFANQSVGIDEVIRAVNPDRGGHDGLAQLAQLSFAARTESTGFRLAGTESTPLELGNLTAQEPLGLMVVFDCAGGARIEATYRTDSCTEATVRQLLTHYLRFLDGALRAPDVPIRTVELLDPAERADILAASHGALVTAAPTTLTAMLQRQVAATPEAVALASDELELTYAELNRRANRLAHWLIDKGVGPEDLVALPLETSIDFVVAAIAVLKAGGAYLPIDPAYPAERIAYLLDDAQPKLVLDSWDYAADSDNPRRSARPDTDPEVTVHPSCLAYVIYTSGSTGKPKGVPVPHAAIAEHLSGFNAEWSVDAHDRVLQSSSVSFDASMLDIFVTLTKGARLVVPKPNAYRDLPYVADLITRHGVTVLHMVPSMLATFLMLPDVAEWRALRHVPVGGEALPGEVADRFATVFDAKLRNHYGPTEAVVSATHMPVDGPQGTRIVPIGKPNQNVYLYLLDDALQLVPDGVVGEIYLGGAQLARGYLNRPGLSAQRFVADPFSPGGRLYRSGDLARRNADGDIEFVGRADEQVKVRGFRIELGEVEAVITEHPAVAHCVVIAAEQDSVGPILAAYVVAGAGEVDLDAVRAHVAARLPEHMVPAAFAVIPEIPLTVHGKLDRRALPEPMPVSTQPYREPRTATEQRIGELFATLFKRDLVGADDSFFALGGHSLLAARLVTMVNSEFGVEIDVRAAFDHPTVSGLAAHVAAVFREEFGVDLDEDTDNDLDAAPDGPVQPTTTTLSLTKQARPEHVPLSYSQRAYWIQRNLEGPITGENVPFAVRVSGPVDLEVLRAAVADVFARHESLRTTFPADATGTPYQLIAPAGPVPIEVVSGAPSDDDRIAWDEYVFDLSSEPLVRVRLYVLDDDTHELAVLMHHIICDQRSCQIFVDDLVVAYRARLQGDSPSWSELPIQFADFAMWQRTHFDRGSDSTYGAAQIDYWRTSLAGLPDEIAVAHDRPRPPVLGRDGVATSRTLPAATWAAVKAVGEATGATEFMLCQAAGAVTLAALGAGDDIAIGAAVANRIASATDELVGLFANVVVLRTNLSGEPALRDVLTRVRETSLDAISRQVVPFERVVETINPPRRLSRNPLFQVMMHFRHRAQPVPLDASTVLTPLPAEYEVSFMDVHFDYTVEPSGDVSLRVVVNPDLYEPDTGAVFADVLVRVLTAFAETPDVAVTGLDVLPAGWTRTARVVAAATATAPVDVDHVAPQTDTERTLVALLEELLEIDEIGCDDGFFALGGDSVMAIQWATRANEHGLALTPQLVFEHPTIGELAAAVEAAEPAPAAETVEHAPMSLSGLGTDALADLKASWASR